MNNTTIYAFIEIRPNILALSSLCKLKISECKLDVTKLPTELQNKIIKSWECPTRLQLLNENGVEYWNTSPEDSIIIRKKEAILLFPVGELYSDDISIAPLRGAPIDASDDISQLIASWNQPTLPQVTGISYLTFKEILDWRGWESSIKAGTMVQPADLDTTVEDLKKQGAEFTTSIQTRTGIYVLSWEIPKRRCYTSILDKLNEFMDKYNAKPENIRMIGVAKKINS